MPKNKVLIIKTGYSEVLDDENNSRKVSLGDVLRTTPLLHLYRDDYVTWVGDEQAFPLLENNPYINRLIPLDFTNSMHLLDEYFDTIINLEKNHDICKFSSRLDAWRRFGFRLDRKSGLVHAYDRAFEVLAVSSDPISKKENKRTTQELLFEMVGGKWEGEEYILGYVPTTREKYDIGLNTLVGQKWPTKAWPDEYWDLLEEKLTKDGLKISRQDKQPLEVLEDLRKYIDWINSCNTIVSNDSLGLHLGIVLKKRVLGMFGPTPDKEVHFYGRGKAIHPEPIPPCLPCFEPICARGRHCMDDIFVGKVYGEIMENVSS